MSDIHDRLQALYDSREKERINSDKRIEKMKELENERKERERAEAEASKNVPVVEMSEQLAGLRDLVKKTVPGEIYATEKILRALSGILEISDYLLQQEQCRQSVSENQSK